MAYTKRIQVFILLALLLQLTACFGLRTRGSSGGPSGSPGFDGSDHGDDSGLGDGNPDASNTFPDGQASHDPQRRPYRVVPIQVPSVPPPVISGTQVDSTGVPSPITALPTTGVPEKKATTAQSDLPSEILDPALATPENATTPVSRLRNPSPAKP